MTDHKKDEPKLTADEKVAAQRAEEDAAIARVAALADVNLDVSLAGLASFLPVVTHLLNLGVTVTEMAEKVAEFAAPGDVPALEALVKVLQEAVTLLGKA
jgi:hypothetical protein